MKDKTKVAVLVSGRGSNLEAIVANSEAGRIDADVVLVISDKKDAKALEIAGKHGIEAVWVNPKEFPAREEHERKIIDLIESRKAGLVCMAGYMRVLTGVFVRHFSGRLMNIHPTLLPSFPGSRGQLDALECGVKISGCTVHFVDEGTDTGPIIIQAAVPVSEGDTVETLSGRILKEEHKIYSRAIQYFAEGRLEIAGKKVKILPVKGAGSDKG